MVMKEEHKQVKMDCSVLLALTLALAESENCNSQSKQNSLRDKQNSLRDKQNSWRDMLNTRSSRRRKRHSQWRTTRKQYQSSWFRGWKLRMKQLRMKEVESAPAAALHSFLLHVGLSALQSRPS